MTDEQTPQRNPSAPNTETTATETTATETTATETPDAGKTPSHWRSRRWLAGATLVTVGLAAGGGVTYAFTATNNDGAGNGTSAVSYGGPGGGPAGRPTGAPPGSSGATSDGQPT